MGAGWSWRGFRSSVEPGTFTAILGPDGRGKSTLMRALNGGIAVNSGKYFLMATSRSVDKAVNGTRLGGRLHRRQSFDFP